MTKDELKTRLEAAEKQMIGLQDEIENLKAKLDEVHDEEIPEYPTFECGEKYYPYCHYSGNAHGTTWEGETQAMDYNCFHSAEYHQFFDAKIRELAMLLHCKWYLDREINSNFDGETCNFFVWYNHLYGEWIVDWNRSNESTTVYFSTKEAAQKAADWMNAHAKRGDSDDD